jgi:hypothetical protein
MRGFDSAIAKVIAQPLIPLVRRDKTARVAKICGIFGAAIRVFARNRATGNSNTVAKSENDAFKGIAQIQRICDMPTRNWWTFDRIRIEGLALEKRSVYFESRKAKYVASAVIGSGLANSEETTLNNRKNSKSGNGSGSLQFIRAAVIDGDPIRSGVRTLDNPTARISGPKTFARLN